MPKSCKYCGKEKSSSNIERHQKRCKATRRREASLATTTNSSSSTPDASIDTSTSRDVVTATSPTAATTSPASLNTSPSRQTTASPTTTNNNTSTSFRRPSFVSSSSPSGSAVGKEFDDPFAPAFLGASSEMTERTNAGGRFRLCYGVAHFVGYHTAIGSFVDESLLREPFTRIPWHKCSLTGASPRVYVEEPTARFAGERFDYAVRYGSARYESPVVTIVEVRYF
jgi:hypothetical protein